MEGESEKDLFGQGAAAIGALFEQNQQELEAEGETGPAGQKYPNVVHLFAHEPRQGTEKIDSPFFAGLVLAVWLGIHDSS